MKTIPVELTIKSSYIKTFPVQLTIKRDIDFPKKPSEQVAHVIIEFLNDIFQENFDRGNFHLNPRTEMYIRDEYPQDVEESGIKPAIIFDEGGSVTEKIPYVGQVGYIPMSRWNLHTIRGNDEVYQGRIRIRTLSTAEEEAEDLAYLTYLSLKEYADFVVGKSGITDIIHQGFSKATPMEVSSDYEFWGCTVDLGYIITLLHSRINLEGDRLEVIGLKKVKKK